jgi:OmpA-OmpF porin, OOP family
MSSRHIPNSKTLVFASKGRIGMGGFDLFSSQENAGAWSEPVNPGSPLNSVKDDIYFTSTGNRSVWEEGYISTDRQSTCCLEVFRFNKMNSPKLVLGKIIDCHTKQVLSQASVKLSDKTGWSVQLQSDENGMYQLEIQDYKSFEIYAEKTHYHGALLNVIAPSPDAGMDSLFNADICLTLIPEMDTVGFSAPRIIYFDFNKAELQNEGREVLDALVLLMKERPSLHLEMFGYTDGKGSNDYNQKLSDARVKSSLDYLVDNGIDLSRLVIKGNGECCQVEAEQTKTGEDNPTARGRNRRVEFRIKGY